MPDIFLSYSRDDQVTARRFAEGFERAGLSVWWDQSLNPGEAFDKVTEKALEEASAVVVLWSKKSVDSRWVRSEAMQANSGGKLIPVMIEPCKRPIMFELTHTVDLAGWNGDSNDREWQSFLAGMRRISAKGEPDKVVPQQAAPASRFSARSLAIPLVLLLLIAGGAAWKLSRKPADVAMPTGAPATTRAATATKVPDEASLAVLPFVNMSSDKEQEYFSDGLTEELLNQLAQIKGLRVTARTSSFAFKGKSEDVRAIGKALDVSNILEGSVRKDGKHLAITAQLIDSRTGDHLWSNTFTRELADIFAIQEDIAKAVASALQIKLGVDGASRARAGTTNVEAYDKYLRATALVSQGGIQERQRGVQLLREAVKLDPSFTSAWIGLLIALGQTLVYSPTERDAALTEMERVRARLRALAPDDPLIHTARAIDFTDQRRWAEGEAEVRAATASDSGDASSGVGIVIGGTGRINEALEYFARARRKDPLSLEASSWLQFVLDIAGRSREAQAEYERSKDLVGNHSGNDWITLQRLWANPATSADDVEAQFGLYLQGQERPMEMERLLVGRLGDRARALAAIRKAFDDPANQVGGRMYAIASYADHFGDRDLALAALRRAFIDLDTNFAFYLWWPYETRLRSDPRFKQLLRDMGLADFYRSSGKWGDFCKPLGKDDFECH